MSSWRRSARLANGPGKKQPAAVPQPLVSVVERPDELPSRSRGDLLAALPAIPAHDPQPAPPHQFTFRVTPRPDDGLSLEARHLMAELRGEAARIRADMAVTAAPPTTGGAQEERESGQQYAEETEQQQQANGLEGQRRFAQPRRGRFSAAHRVQFQKMDSIERHPSRLRAMPACPTTPLPALKRSRSKANLDDHDRDRNQDPGSSARSPAKRTRQGIQDDASTLRPISQDGLAGSLIPRLHQPPPTRAPPAAASCGVSPAPQTPVPTAARRTGLPRSTSNLASLLSPTKASLARAVVAASPTVASPLNRLKKSATNNFVTGEYQKEQQGEKDQKDQSIGRGQGYGPSSNPKTVEALRHSHFDRVKAILRVGRSAVPTTPRPAAATPAIPATPATPTIPAAPTARLGSVAPPPPPAPMARSIPPVGTVLESSSTLTRRGTRLIRRMAPSAAVLPKADDVVTITTPACTPTSRATPAVMHQTVPAAGSAPVYPTVQSVLSPAVSYPDLSHHPAAVTATPASPAVVPRDAQHDRRRQASTPPSVPGTFTFRTDRTIRFGGSSPRGFGAMRGQASVRQVVGGYPAPVPGAFPIADKENTGPASPLTGKIKMKRGRVGEDEEREAAPEAKRRRVETPSAAVAGPLTGKKPGLTMNRLNALAQPKKYRR